MALSQVSILVLVIAVLGRWIINNRFVRYGDQTGLENHKSLERSQEGPRSTYVYKFEENHNGLDVDDNYGIECIQELRRTLTFISCIYVVIGTDQMQIENMLGESLVTDRLFRLELLHDTNIEEGKHFKIMRKEIHPELQNALKKGSILEIWDLTEMLIDSLHLYSAKVLGHSGRMKSGIENAKATGKLENLSWEEIRALAFLAGAEKCVIEEWLRLKVLMYDYLDWVGNRLQVQRNVINDKKVILDTILDRAYVSGSYADVFVKEIGVTNVTSKLDIWFQKEFIDNDVKWGSEQNPIHKSDDKFMMFGFTTKFDLNTERIVIRNKCPFAIAF